MGARLRTQITQLSIVGGAQLQGMSNTRLAETSSRGLTLSGTGDLYLLVDVTGDPVGKDEVCRELIEILTEEYFRVPGGITNGLRQAIRAANRFLFDRNAESLPLWRRLGETSCAVLRGNDLYMGVAGGAVIYVLQQGRLRVFPRRSTDRTLSTGTDEAVELPPLGAESYLHRVGLYHCRIEAHDIVVLASSSLPRLASQQEVVRAAAGGLRELDRTLISLASHSDLHALLIETETAATEPTEQRAPSTSRDRIMRSPLKRRRETPVGEAVEKVPTRKSGWGPGKLVVTIGALILSFFAGLARGGRTFFSWLFSSGIFEAIGSTVTTAFAALLRGLGTMTKRMLPEPKAAAQPMEVAHARPIRRVSHKKRSAAFPLIGVLTILGVVAIVATGLVIQNRSRAARFSQLLDEAEAELGEARASLAPTSIREHLGIAQERLEEALQMRPTDAEALGLQESVSVALDEVNHVVRVEFSGHVSFDDPNSYPSRVVLHENDVYVLDEGTRQLYGYLLDGLGGFQETAGGAVLLGPQSPPGDTAVETVNDLVWMEFGNGRETSNLLLVVNGSSILQLTGLRGFASVSVSDNNVLAEPRAIGAYFGYLYVLDAEQDRILKYAPTGNSYDYPSADYFPPGTSVELGDAVDMAIDGHIYVLLAEGTLLKFLGGQEQAFSIQGLEDQSLVNPTAIFTSPGTEYIYVADAGNERVVQLDKEGTFVRQFRPRREDNAFHDLRDVAVNEATGELVVLNSDGLMLAPVTPLQAQ